jgi:hypothetical protein
MPLIRHGQRATTEQRHTLVEALAYIAEDSDHAGVAWMDDDASVRVVQYDHDRNEVRTWNRRP